MARYYGTIGGIDMNKELEDKLNEFLGKIIDGLEQGGEFVLAEIPEVVEQALLWISIKSGVFFALGVIIFMMLIPLYRNLKKNLYKTVGKNRNINENVLFGSMIAVICVLFLSIPLMFLNLQWLQIMIAPKWFIITELGKLL